MSNFQLALILLLIIAGLSVIARWLPWPIMITYLLGGIIAASIPGFPSYKLDPDFFFLCFLPPLLFSDGWLMPLREFMQAKRPIFTLAVGLVVFTMLLVGFAAWLLVPGLPLPMAFALGAIVSPTDAVAINAITERLRVPQRLITVLNGESLMNDATGLVAFKFSLAAIVAGSFSLGNFVVAFSTLAAGGIAIGLIVAYLIGKVRDLLRGLDATDSYIEITVSLMTPFAAYLPAEHVGVSGILAVVAAGLYSGWRDPVRMDVETRQTMFAVWNVVLFWLTGVAFVLLGLQFPSLYAAVRGSYSHLQLIGLTSAVSGAAIAARLLWSFAGIYAPMFIPGVCRRDTRPATAFIIGWSGMRGAITLAGALSIPFALPNGAPFPGRDIVIFLASGVIAVTLLLHGLTLERIILKLGLREDSTEAEEERFARTSAVRAGLQALRAHSEDDLAPEDRAALGQVIGEYEHRLAVLTADGEDRRRARQRRIAGHRFRSLALQAEREAIDSLWTSEKIADGVHRPLQQLLDHEEALLRQNPPPPL